MKYLLIIISIFSLFFLACLPSFVDNQIEVDTTASLGVRTADHNITRVLYEENIPESAIIRASDTLHIGYGHTSHGSQLTTGMTGLVAFANDNFTSYSDDLFVWSQDGTDGLHLFEGSGYTSPGYLELDCGYNDWDTETREYLNAYPTCNVIMWSWCGQVWEVNVTTHYLDKMDALEQEYPEKTFIYMTGHLDEPVQDAIFLNNEIIRNYCKNNDKWLFDFADIEKYNLDGYDFSDRLVDDSCYYDSDNDGVLEMPVNDWDPVLPEHDANWAVEWQDSHDENIDWYNCDSSHSEPLNANQKAYAIWWLFSRIAGWEG